MPGIFYRKYPISNRNDQAKRKLESMPPHQQRRVVGRHQLPSTERGSKVAITNMFTELKDSTRKAVRSEK